MRLEVERRDAVAELAEERELRTRLVHELEEDVRRLRGQASGEISRLERELEAAVARVAPHSTTVETQTSVPDDLREAEVVRAAFAADIGELEGELRRATAFDDARREMRDVQRAALLASRVEREILRDEVREAEAGTYETVELQRLNTVWREKYAYMAGEAKATKALFERLCRAQTVVALQ